MEGPEAIVTLPETDPERLAGAVRATLASQEELADQLRVGAEDTMRGEVATVTARRFQTLLELGYLVASADGFADQERSSLAHLLESVTGSAIDHDVLELHFKDLDAAVAQLGRRERLARAAAELAPGTGPRTEVERTVSAVATIALSDGCLSALEYTVLLELGEHLGLQPAEVSSLVDAAAERVRKGLTRSHR